jgi:hypothetical protein
VPDEQSNLNSPASARRPNNRRRGRRGGRGRARVPRPAPGNAAAPNAEDTSPAPESANENLADTAENETELSPAPAVAPENSVAASLPENSSAPAAENSAAEKPVAEQKSQPPLRPERPERPDRPQRPERPERPERFERRNEPRPPKPVYVKPADFRPAETSAIHEAVSIATEIATSLKQMTDQLDEILELVEVAERQKLADEREIDELRRALRRIQPPRQQLHSHEQHRSHSREEPRSRREEPRNQPQNPPTDPVETHEPENSGEETPTRLE